MVIFNIQSVHVYVYDLFFVVALIGAPMASGPSAAAAAGAAAAALLQRQLLYL